MKNCFSGKILFTLIALSGLFPLYGEDRRSSPIAVNLIVDGSSALGGVMDAVSAWVSGSVLDRILQDGDRVTVWIAGGEAKIAYSDTITGSGGKDTIKKALTTIPAQGDTADFAGALRDAASRNSGGGITYTLLISASTAALSPTLLGANASLVRFSRVEEFRGWRAMVIALNIDSKVRRAANAWLTESS
ncbi:MAG: hypothetical protein LBD18_00290 [Treponema sp.]|jgi:hypothetical protein|nr:hypothetical protein [Treponema sp.]